MSFFLDLPPEIRAIIYEFVYGSAIVHVCSQPQSLHSFTYPPQQGSGLGCVERDVHLLDPASHPIQPTYVTTYAHVDGNHFQRVPSSKAMLSPLRINREISAEVKYLLQRAIVMFYAVNIDAYSIYGVLKSLDSGLQSFHDRSGDCSDPSAKLHFPLGIQSPWIARQVLSARRIDVNVQSDIFPTARSVMQTQFKNWCQRHPQAPRYDDWSAEVWRAPEVLFGQVVDATRMKLSRSLHTLSLRRFRQLSQVRFLFWRAHILHPALNNSRVSEQRPLDDLMPAKWGRMVQALKTVWQEDEKDIQIELLQAADMD